VKTKLAKPFNEGAREKIKIFEDPENRKVQDERENQPLFPARIRATGRNSLGDQKIHRGAEDHEREEAPVPPAVEKVAGEQKENVLGAVTETPVQQHDWYQEQEISWRVKKHGAESNGCVPFSS
jgi:hypothetical protein